MSLSYRFFCNATSPSHLCLSSSLSVDILHVDPPSTPPLIPFSLKLGAYASGSGLDLLAQELQDDVLHKHGHLCVSAVSFINER